MTNVQRRLLVFKAPQERNLGRNAKPFAAVSEVIESLSTLDRPKKTSMIWRPYSRSYVTAPEPLMRECSNEATSAWEKRLQARIEPDVWKRSIAALATSPVGGSSLFGACNLGPSAPKLHSEGPM